MSWTTSKGIRGGNGRGKTDIDVNLNGGLATKKAVSSIAAFVVSIHFDLITYFVQSCETLTNITGRDGG
jgi:hypothetical protein